MHIRHFLIAIFRFYLYRIYMHHDVFDLREIFLDGIMYCFCDLVCFAERLISIRADLNVHIDLVAKYTCHQKIDSLNTVYSRCTVTELLFCLCIAGLINHFFDSIHENVVGCLDDKYADDDTGNGIQNGKTESCTANTDERAYG